MNESLRKMNDIISEKIHFIKYDILEISFQIFITYLVYHFSFANKVDTIDMFIT